MLLLALSAIEICVMAVLVGLTISRLSRKEFSSSECVIRTTEPASIGVLDLPVVSTPTGCYYSGVISLSALFWVPGLIYEPVLFALVIYKAQWFKQQGPKIPLIQQMARDRYVHISRFYAVH